MDQQEFVLHTIRLSLIFLAASIVPLYVFSLSLKYLFRLTVLFLLLLLISIFFPLFKVDGVGYSIWNYIASGNSSYAVMSMCYFFTIIAVITRNKRLTFYSGFVFFVGFIFAYGGLFFLGDKIINQAIDEDKWGSISWLLLYYVIPLIALLFYIPYTHKLIKS